MCRRAARLTRFEPSRSTLYLGDVLPPFPRQEVMFLLILLEYSLINDCFRHGIKEFIHPLIDHELRLTRLKLLPETENRGVKLNAR